MMLDKVLKMLEDAGTFELCKACAERGKTCCDLVSPFEEAGVRCRYLKDGCTNRNMECALFLCTLLKIRNPELVEELDNVRKTK